MKRFFECLIPVTACNLKCEYCYVIQRNNRTMQMPQFKYSPEHIGKALSKERLGGVCYFSICGAGETLLPHETLEIAKLLITNGHYVNITTNGTITPRFEEILSWEEKYRKQLHIAFSLHYIELKRKNLLRTFFDNVKRIRQGGCSIIVQINLYDGYFPYWDEIKELCITEVGAAPQVAVTRDEEAPRYKFHTSHTEEEYIAKGREFHSPLWDFTLENFNKHRTRQFCYAGDWSGTLNLCTGIMTGCYGQGIEQDIFANIHKPIKFQPIGCTCSNKFCMNSSHFLSLGNIPSYPTPSYASLRNRQDALWYTEDMEQFLSQKLFESNIQYNGIQKIMLTVRMALRSFIKRLYIAVARVYFKIKKIFNNE